MAAAAGRSAAAIAGRMFNCSDIVVSNRDIVRLVHRFAGICRAAAGSRRRRRKASCDCDALAALGVTFGGWPLFEETIGELVAAVRRRARPEAVSSVWPAEAGEVADRRRRVRRPAPRARGRAATRSCSVCWSSTSMKAPSADSEDAVDRRRRLDQAVLVQLAEAVGLDVRLLGQPHDVADADFRRRAGEPAGRRGGRASS